MTDNMTDTKTLTSYRREKIAQTFDDINHQIDLCPHRYPLTPEERVEWTAFPAQARAHPFPVINIDPDHSLADYMRSGRISPNCWPFKKQQATKENQCK